jgi:DNA polymerase beta
MPQKAKPKEPDVVDDTLTVNIKNEPIVKEFLKLLDQIKIQIDIAPSTSEYITNSFRLKQIMNALSIIKKYPEEIKSGADLKGIKGIGKGTMTRIDEILKTGKLSEIKIGPEEEKYSKYIEELQQIHGIGHRTAYDFVVKFGIKSIEQLKKAYNDGTIELTDQAIMGLKYHGVALGNIPRAEITEIDKYLQAKAKSIDSGLIVTICGSYRRLKATSNDIDVLIAHPKVKTKLQIKQQSEEQNYLYRLIKELKEDKFIIDDLTDKDYTIKYMGYLKWKSNPVRRLDMRLVPMESYPSALLYYTGSGPHNVKIRALAESMKMMLNEYGLYKLVDSKKIKIKVTSEKDIFEKLGLEYLPPQLRN